MIKISCVCLILLLTVNLVAVAENDEIKDSYSIWIGGHYTSFDDYTKKVGEYKLENEDFLPEFKINYLSQSPNSFFYLDGYYFDYKNIFGQMKATVSDRFKGNFQYRSLVKNEGQDLLGNLEAREYFPDRVPPAYGAKTLTHEILDPDAGYDTHRQEILSEMSYLMSRDYNVRLVATHRSILKDGYEQKIASNHCFSCHQTSMTAEVETRQHQFETGIDAEVDKYVFGYRFGYRHFQSNSPDATAYYDEAKHPVSGGSGEELSSRVIYDDTTMAFSVYPTTEKLSHKVHFKGDLGKGRFSSSLGYSRVENKDTEIASKAYTGAAKYTVPINNKTRVIAKVSGYRVKTDDPFVDVPSFREGRTGPVTSFDYVRASSLDRKEGKISAELITRLNPKMTLSVLAGFDGTDRYDYPVVEDGTYSKKFYAQAKYRYRKGLKYSVSLKYRFEKISDPFVSARGLFEGIGRDLLTALEGSPGNQVFYWQREGIRYQDITSMPTDVHVFEWTSNYKPNKMYTVNVGLKGKYDKNGDLDSLDVKHLSLVPNLYVNVTPDMKWMLTTGYTYNYDKSRLPVAVALFDG